MTSYRRNHQKSVFFFWVCVRGRLPPINSYSGWYLYVWSHIITGRQKWRSWQSTLSTAAHRYPGERLCVLGARDAVETPQRLEKWNV